MFKLIPLLCTHVYSYMFSTVHPPRCTLDILFSVNNPHSFAQTNCKQRYSVTNIKC